MKSKIIPYFKRTLHTYLTILHHFEFLCNSSKLLIRWKSLTQVYQDKIIRVDSLLFSERYFLFLKIPTMIQWIEWYFFDTPKYLIVLIS